MAERTLVLVKAVQLDRLLRQNLAVVLQPADRKDESRTTNAGRATQQQTTKKLVLAMNSTPALPRSKGIKKTEKAM